MSDTTGLENLKLCPDCGNELRPGRAYCSKCGKKHSSTCKDCGSVLAAGDAYCAACGSKAVDNLCPNCSAQVRYRNQAFCTECGTMLSMQCAACGAAIESEFAYCGHCGRKLDAERIDIRSASRLQERMAEITANTDNDTDDAETFNKKGMAFFQSEQLVAAIQYFQKAIDMEPSNPSYHCNLAVALDEDDQDEEALREYELTLQLNPDDTTALLYLGYMYSENEETQKAIEMWKRVIQIAPGTAEAEEASDNLSHLTEL